MGQLAGLITEALEEGQRRWPAVRVDRDAFASYVEARLNGDERPDHLQSLDLLLACACHQGQAAAIEAFRESYVPGLRAHLLSMRLPDAAIQDLLAQLTEELLTAHPDAAPKIGQYAGRSTLQVWLQVVVTRMALRVLEREKRYTSMDSTSNELSDATSPELTYLKQLYGDAFKAAFEEAVRGLTARERNLLRYQYIDGLTGDEIARLHGTHRATIVRWLARARETLLATTRDLLISRLSLDPKEFESIARLVQSQLDFSIRTLLAVQAP